MKFGYQSECHCSKTADSPSRRIATIPVLSS